jgi:hypothetical protein
VLTRRLRCSYSRDIWYLMHRVFRRVWCGRSSSDYHASCRLGEEVHRMSPRSSCTYQYRAASEPDIRTLS